MRCPAPRCSVSLRYAPRGSGMLQCARLCPTALKYALMASSNRICSHGMALLQHSMRCVALLRYAPLCSVSLRYARRGSGMLQCARLCPTALKYALMASFDCIWSHGRALLQQRMRGVALLRGAPYRSVMLRYAPLYSPWRRYALMYSAMLHHVIV